MEVLYLYVCVYVWMGRVGSRYGEQFMESLKGRDGEAGKGVVMSIVCECVCCVGECVWLFFVYQAPVSPKCFTSRTTFVTVVTCWVVCCLCVRATSAAAAAATAAEFGAVESDGTSLCTDKCEEFGECSVAWPLL